MDPEQLERLEAILAAMPAAQPPRGFRPDWGSPANRARAYYLAAQTGMNANPNCLSCDADVYDHLLKYVNKG